MALAHRWDYLLHKSNFAVDHWLYSFCHTKSHTRFHVVVKCLYHSGHASFTVLLLPLIPECLGIPVVTWIQLCSCHSYFGLQGLKLTSQIVCNQFSRNRGVLSLIRCRGFTTKEIITQKTTQKLFVDLF